MNNKSNKLDSGIDMQIEQLSDSIDGYEGEVLGYGTMYTVGADYNCVVPRDWLVRKAEELRLPEYLLPKQVSPTYAFSRAMNRMTEEWDNEFWFSIPRLDGGPAEPHEVRVDFRDGDETRLTHVYCRTFFDSDESGEEGGRWISQKIGHINYDRDNDRIVTRSNDLAGKKALQKIWAECTGTIRQWKQEMEQSHIARDIRQMMYTIINERTETVIPLRRSVYLFPAGLGDIVDKMSELFSAIDEQFKAKGEEVAVRTFEVLNTEEKRDWIETKVQEEVSGNIDSILETAFDEFDEDATADEALKLIRDNVSIKEQTAEQYNSLLEAEISVKNLLREKKQEITNEKKQDIVDAVIQQSEVSGY